MDSNIVSESPTTVLEVETVAVTETPTAPTAPSGIALVPIMAMTPRRGTARKLPKEPNTLMAFAIEQGGRIELTDANKQELAARGLPNHRISNAAYGIRKCFGKVVTAERIGRTVSAYTVSL